jgi:predicted Fe-Mo cluster-binding NifX family protein
VIRLENNREIERFEIDLTRIYPRNRVLALVGFGVTNVICGGITHGLYTALKTAGIQVLYGVGGAIEDVMRALVENCLDEPKFRMAGFKNIPLEGKLVQKASIVAYGKERPSVVAVSPC